MCSIKSSLGNGESINKKYRKLQGKMAFPSVFSLSSGVYIVKVLLRSLEMQREQKDWTCTPPLTGKRNKVIRSICGRDGARA